MHIAGLTGGTGAGKSSAAKQFRTHGIPVIDADRVGHTLIEPGGEAVDEVVHTFGEEIAPCGTISREKLGALVFKDPEALAALNGIMQPRIAGAIARQCARYAQEGQLATIIDGATLADRGRLEPWLDSLILVSSPEAHRQARLVASRGWSESQALQRIRAQVDPESKRPLARWIIDNDQGLDAFFRAVDRVAEALLEECRSTVDGTV